MCAVDCIRATDWGMTVAPDAVIVIFDLDIRGGWAVSTLRKCLDTSGNIIWAIYHKWHVICIPAPVYADIFRNCIFTDLSTSLSWARLESYKISKWVHEHEESSQIQSCFFFCVYGMHIYTPVQHLWDRAHMRSNGIWMMCLISYGSLYLSVCLLCVFTVAVCWLHCCLFSIWYTLEWVIVW